MAQRRDRNINAKLSEAAKAETATITGGWTFSAATTFSADNTFSGNNTFSGDNTFSGANTISGATTVTGVMTHLDQNTPLKFDVATDNDVDFQWILDDTLTALWRWDSSANIFRFQDRTPSAVNVFNIDLENRQLVLQYDATDLCSQTMSNEAFTLDSTQHIRLSPGSGHYVQVYDPGATTHFRVYDSTGGDAMYCYHDGTDFQMGTTGTTPGKFIINTPDDVVLDLDATKALEITGSSYKINPTGLRLGQYTASRVYLQVPAGGSGDLDIWDSGTSTICRFAEANKQVTCYGNFSADAAGATIAIGGQTLNISPSGNTNITSGGTTQCLSGGDMRCYDSTNTDYVRMVDTGTWGYLETNTNPLRLRAAASVVSMITVEPSISLADDASGEFTNNGGVYGFWFLTNNYNTTTFAIVSHTGTTCTTISAGGNVAVGASGTNPDTDGKVNIWTDSAGNLHVKNRMGSTRRFTAYNMSG